MPVVIIIEKLLILAVYASAIYMIVSFKNENSGTKIEFDTISKLEMSMVTGVSLVSLVSVINPKTYLFTAGLCLISVVAIIFIRQRIVLAGDRKVLLKGKSYRIKDVIALGAGMFTLHVKVKNNDKDLKIYVPLTSNRVLKENIQSKIVKK